MGTGFKAPGPTGDWSDSQERMQHHKFSVHLAKPFSASSPLLSATGLRVIKVHFLFTSSAFTSLLVKSFTQSMKQFSVTLLYVPRNSLNCEVSRETRPSRLFTHRCHQTTAGAASYCTWNRALQQQTVSSILHYLFDLVGLRNLNRHDTEEQSTLFQKKSHFSIHLDLK